MKSLIFIFLNCSATINLCFSLHMNIGVFRFFKGNILFTDFWSRLNPLSSEIDKYAIQHALDQGADGIQVPNVENSEDAQKVVDFSKLLDVLLMSNKLTVVSKLLMKE